MKVILNALLLAGASVTAMPTVDMCALDGYGMPASLPVSDENHVTGEGVLDPRLASHELALTIDDGPFPWNTNTVDMLNVLLQNDVKATFFVIGTYVEERPDLLQMIVDAGHEVAVHTFSHRDMTMLNETARAEEIQNTLDAIDAALPGYQPRYWRPPYGATSDAIRDEVLAKFGLAQALWTLDTEDWKFENTVTEIEATLLQGAGHIVLLHDGAQNSDQSVLAVQKALPELLAQGAELKTMSQLDLQASGCTDVVDPDDDGDAVDNTDNDCDGVDDDCDIADDGDDTPARKRRRHLRRLRRKLRRLRHRAHRRRHRRARRAASRLPESNVSDSLDSDSSELKSHKSHKSSKSSGSDKSNKSHQSDMSDDYY
ncbi:MAG: hypothetical protein MHM6MM_007938 [Cercozoa sp. M6MM]